MMSLIPFYYYTRNSTKVAYDKSRRHIIRISSLLFLMSVIRLLKAAKKKSASAKRTFDHHIEIEDTGLSS